MEFCQSGKVGTLFVFSADVHVVPVYDVETPRFHYPPYLIWSFYGIFLREIYGI